MELRFQCTCDACPEQYDVYAINEETGIGVQVAYVRLRWGHLSVNYPDHAGERIYTHIFDDSLQGCFDTHEEQEKYLGEVKEAILKRLEQDE